MGFWPSAAVFVVAYFLCGVMSVGLGRPSGFIVGVAVAGLVTWYVRRRMR